MKRLIIINLILILGLYLIPNQELQHKIVVEEQNITKEEVTEQKSGIIQEEIKTPLNLNLSVDTDLRIKSNLSAEQFETILEDYSNLKGLGNAIYEAENTYNINGLYMIGLICLESGYGKSKYATQRNNLVGWNAVDSNPNKASYFNTKSECILYVAKYMQKHYLTEGGKYFNGYSGRDVDVRYASDPLHADKIINIVNTLLNRKEFK